MKGLRIFLMADYKVGWQVARYLKQRGEHIVGLAVHPPRIEGNLNRGYTKKIIQELELPKGKIFDADDLKKKITPRTKAIIPVHLGGHPCDMDAIMTIAKRHNLKVIEDCAHAIETEYHGKKAGTFGEIGCFSFYATKNIVTGEGGMAVTNNEAYASKIKIMGLHGMSKDAWKRFGDSGYKHYQVLYAGFKYNMMDTQAAMGMHQLKRIDTYSERRKQIWNKYNEAFKNLALFLPAPEEKNTRHAHHLYTILLDTDKLRISRDQFLDEMTKRNIGVGVHYTALHLHPFYQERFHYKKGDFPNTEWIGERTVSIPLSPKLSDQDVNDVIEAVTDILVSNKLPVHQAVASEKQS